LRLHPARSSKHSAFVDLSIQLAHDVIRNVDIERMRVDEQAQDAPRRTAGAPQEVVPVEIVDADDAERVVPVPRSALVMHGGLDHEKILGRDEPQPMAEELPLDGAREHLVVEIEAAGGVEN